MSSVKLGTRRIDPLASFAEVTAHWKLPQEVEVVQHPIVRDALGNDFTALIGNYDHMTLEFLPAPIAPSKSLNQNPFP